MPAKCTNQCLRVEWGTAFCQASCLLSGPGFRPPMGRRRHALSCEMNMNFDERLEKLATRHEALAQTVEFIAGMQLRTEKVLVALAEAQVKTENAMAELQHGMAELRNGMVGVQDAIQRLARIAESHEQRLDRLEGE